jgi:serine/threonine protein kinase
MSYDFVHYDTSFEKIVLEWKLLTPLEVQRVKEIQAQLEAVQIFHRFGKICLELNQISQKDSVRILERIRQEGRLKEKPFLNTFLMPKELSDAFLEEVEKRGLLSPSQLKRCGFLQETLRRFGIERHLCELALEEHFISRTQLEAISRTPSFSSRSQTTSSKVFEAFPPQEPLTPTPSPLSPLEAPVSLPSSTLEKEVFPINSLSLKESSSASEILKELEKDPIFSSVSPQSSQEALKIVENPEPPFFVEPNQSAEVESKEEVPSLKEEVPSSRDGSSHAFSTPSSFGIPTKVLSFSGLSEDSAEVSQATKIIPSPGFVQKVASEVSIKIKELEDYEILREVSRGGMGIIYQARQKSLDRIVAIKVLKSGEEATPALVERFHLEARSVAALSHPNILPVYDIGSIGNCHYFTMEYVHGLSLKEVLEAQKLTFRQTVRIVITVAKALQHAHKKFLCHRDIKPANIMIDQENRIFLMDFGLVKDFNKDLELTHTGALMGTPAYMSPEQIDAKKFGEVGIASDIYSLGAVFYEMLTGVRPFSDMVGGGNAVSMALMILTAALKPPRAYSVEIPIPLEQICLKCLHKKPSDRYSTLEALIEDLEAWVKNQSQGMIPLPSKATSNLSKSKLLFIRQISEEEKNQVRPSLSSTNSTNSTNTLMSVPFGENTAVKRFFPRIPDFQIKKKLHQDLLGDLYIARQESLDRLVQLRLVPKTIRIVTQSQINPLFAEYYEQSKKLSKLYHPHLLPFLDYGAADENFYFIRPYIRGKTLETYLEQNTLSFYRKVEIFSGLASVLTRLSQENLIYLDWIPENILLGSDGELKLLESHIGRSRQGYQSLEEVQNQPLSCLSDQFSLGLLMYHLFYKSPLFPLELQPSSGFSGLSLVEKKRGIVILEQNTKVATELISLLERCLKPNPEDRFREPSLLKEKLEFIKISLLEETIQKLSIDTRKQQGIPIYPQMAGWQYLLVFCYLLLFALWVLFPLAFPEQSHQLYQQWLKPFLFLE